MAASTGTGSNVPERFHAVIYVVGEGESQQLTIDQLTNYLTARYWHLVGVHADLDHETPVEERSGLQDAVEQVRSGTATGLLMDHAVYSALRDLDRRWLEEEVQRHGGFVSAVASGEEGRYAPEDFEQSTQGQAWETAGGEASS